MVPTTTMVNAAAERSACRPAPFSTAPIITASSPSTSPAMLRMSVGPPYPNECRRANARLHPQVGEEGVDSGLVADYRRPMIDAGNRRPVTAARVDAGRRGGVCAGQAREIDEHDLHFGDEVHHTPDDLAGEILIVLREQHFVQV